MQLGGGGTSARFRSAEAGKRTELAARRITCFGSMCHGGNDQTSVRPVLTRFHRQVELGHKCSTVRCAPHDANCGTVCGLRSRRMESAFGECFFDGHSYNMVYCKCPCMWGWIFACIRSFLFKRAIYDGVGEITYPFVVGVLCRCKWSWKALGEWNYHGVHTRTSANITVAPHICVDNHEVKSCNRSGWWRAPRC